MERIGFRDLILPWLGADTYFLYAPVCREWSAAYANKVTHPRHLVADCSTYQRLRREIGVNVDTYAARYAGADVLALFPEKNEIALLDEAAKFGNLAAVERFRHSTFRPDEKSKLMIIAAEYGRINVLDYLFPGYPLTDIDIGSDEIEAAARGGQIKVLEWIEAKGWVFDEDEIDGSIAPMAAKMGHQHVLDWLDIRWDSWRNCDLACCYAADGGQLTLLKKLISEGCAFNAEGVFEFAVEAGQFSVVEWINEVYHIEPNSAYIDMAALCWRREIIVWLRALGCDWSDNVYSMALVKAGEHFVLQEAVLDIFDWLFDQGCPVSEAVFRECLKVQAYHDMLEVIEWFVTKGIKLASFEPNELYKIVIESANVNVELVMIRIFNKKCPLQYKSLMQWCIDGSHIKRYNGEVWGAGVISENKRKVISFLLDNVKQIIAAKHVSVK